MRSLPSGTKLLMSYDLCCDGHPFLSFDASLGFSDRLHPASLVLDTSETSRGCEVRNVKYTDITEHPECKEIEHEVGLHEMARYISGIIAHGRK